MSEGFGLIVSWLGGIVAICGGVAYLFKLAKIIISMEENVKKIPELKKDMEYMKKELRDNSLDTYRLVITSERMPLEERIECGEKYITAGGNGAVHKLVDELKQKKIDEDYMKMYNSNDYKE